LVWHHRRLILSFLPGLLTFYIRVDVNVAFLQDSSPRFPRPEDFLPAAAVPVPTTDPDRGLLGICRTADIHTAIKDLYGLNQLIADEITSRNLWIDGVFAGLNIVPVFHRLLSARHEISQENSALLSEESCRLGALLYLAEIRSKFGVNLTPDIHTRKLKDAIMLQGEAAWDENGEILVWLLIIGGIQSLSMEEEHAWYVEALASRAASHGYISWEDLMSLVREVLWIDGVFEVKCATLRDEVSTRSWLLYHHTLS
jgi:hypothetical protein